MHIFKTNFMQCKNSSSKGVFYAWNINIPGLIWKVFNWRIIWNRKIEKHTRRIFFIGYTRDSNLLDQSEISIIGSATTDHILQVICNKKFHTFSFTMHIYRVKRCLKFVIFIKMWEKKRQLTTLIRSSYTTSRGLTMFLHTSDTGSKVFSKFQRFLFFGLLILRGFSHL